MILVVVYRQQPLSFFDTRAKTKKTRLNSVKILSCFEIAALFRHLLSYWKSAVTAFAYPVRGYLACFCLAGCQLTLLFIYRWVLLYLSISNFWDKNHGKVCTLSSRQDISLRTDSWHCSWSHARYFLWSFLKKCTSWLTQLFF